METTDYAQQFWNDIYNKVNKKNYKYVTKEDNKDEVIETSIDYNLKSDYPKYVKMR